MKYYMMGLCFLCLGTIQAQKCSLTFLGEIKDFHDNTPISSANIYITHLDRY
ncbi:MAG: iron complex outermembrane receptor protein, partial [Glaciecola sp.]